MGASKVKERVWLDMDLNGIMEKLPVHYATKDLGTQDLWNGI